MLADSDKEDSWRDFFRALKARGLSGVDLVVSDDHGGLVNAVAIEFQGGIMAALPDSFHQKHPGCVPQGA